MTIFFPTKFHLGKKYNSIYRKIIKEFKDKYLPLFFCKASVVYARKLVSKCAGNDNNTAVASGPHHMHRQEIGFSREQCHVVNNLEFVVDAIRPLPQVSN